MEIGDEQDAVLLLASTVVIDMACHRDGEVGSTSQYDRAGDTPPPDMIGTTLSHYTLSARLGAGGMGVVYQATDARLNRTVALKVLASDAASVGHES